MGFHHQLAGFTFEKCCDRFDKQWLVDLFFVQWYNVGLEAPITLPRSSRRFDQLNPFQFIWPWRIQLSPFCATSRLLDVLAADQPAHPTGALTSPGAVDQTSAEMAVK